MIIAKAFINSIVAKLCVLLLSFLFALLCANPQHRLLDVRMVSTEFYVFLAVSQTSFYF